MGYGFTCDRCGAEHPDASPVLMGQLHEPRFKTGRIGGILADHGFSPEQTITFCADCVKEILL